MGADAVFISYSHDSPEHSDNVLALANALIQMGLQVELDQFVTRPPQGWPHWCLERLRPESAKFVLMICTREYCDRIENRVDFDKGRGAYWEGALIHQYIYEGKGNTRFIPVLMDDAPDDCVPFPLRPYPRYRLKAFDFSDTEFKKLYRELTNQPEIVRPPPGPPVELPPRTVLLGLEPFESGTDHSGKSPGSENIVDDKRTISIDKEIFQPNIRSKLWIGITLVLISLLEVFVNNGYLWNSILYFNDNYVEILNDSTWLYLSTFRESLFSYLYSIHLLYAVLLLVILFTYYRNIYIVYSFSAFLIVDLLILYRFIFFPLPVRSTTDVPMLVFIVLFALIGTTITTLVCVTSFLIYRNIHRLARPKSGPSSLGPSG